MSGAVLVLLAFPIVTDTSCEGGGGQVQASGYGLLGGLDLPAGTLQAGACSIGPDWWIALLILASLAGVASARVTRARGAALRAGVALLSLVSLIVATDGGTLEPRPYVGTVVDVTAYGWGILSSILAVFAVNVVWMVGAALMRWFSWRRRIRFARPSRGPGS